MKLSNQTAVVTGGGTGIGKAIALALAGEGADLALWDVDLDSAQATAEEIRALGRRAIACQTDVSNKAQVEAARDKTLAELDRIDILVNNAGICQKSTIADLPEEDWDRMMAINLKGPFLCSQAVMADMKARRSGSIISLGSVAGRVGGILVAANYSASKAGVICLTKSLAKELAPYGVRANAVAPGPTKTAMGDLLDDGNYDNLSAPLGRAGEPEDVARAIVFLAGPDSSFITGQTIDVNGGLFMS